MNKTQDQAILTCQLYQIPNFDKNIENENSNSNQTYYQNTLESIIKNYTPKIAEITSKPLLIPQYVQKFYRSIDELSELRVNLKKDTIKINDSPIKWNPLITKNFLYIGAGLNLKLMNWSTFCEFETSSKDDLINEELFYTNQIVTELTELKAVAYGLLDSKNISIPPIESIVESLSKLCVDITDQIIL